ncbi:hypothetical protein M427DRAFT_147993 [Gonapodya prolifera JEL478]|uniref:Thioesterase domain-containing protein n=1 Tax=Gonapodya prolifera (strain JEL478) TaxID=1344416 RepID=A0A139A3C5_GONPJ|nr:hypothetical protein M427DRAFT_147993 [Gonapodya prolifera JEL478]|eukprot:KXS11169.1 hypothetical protein M427DRAFT_147993 [Gonapodya prolifera JEL478]
MPPSLSSLLAHLSSLYQKRHSMSSKRSCSSSTLSTTASCPDTGTSQWGDSQHRRPSQGRSRSCRDGICRRRRREPRLPAEWVVTPGDNDINMHLSNTSYGVYADYSRTALIFRSGVSDALVFAAPDPLRRTRMMVGSTEYRYFKEIPIGAMFVMVRLERKWFIVETRFESPSGTVLHCIGCSKVRIQKFGVLIHSWIEWHAKMVVKRGGKTFRPAKMLKEIGIPDDYEQILWTASDWPNYNTSGV